MVVGFLLGKFLQDAIQSQPNFSFARQQFWTPKVVLFCRIKKANCFKVWQKIYLIIFDRDFGVCCNWTQFYDTPIINRHNKYVSVRPIEKPGKNESNWLDIIDFQRNTLDDLEYLEFKYWLLWYQSFCLNWVKTTPTNIVCHAKSLWNTKLQNI